MNMFEFWGISFFMLGFWCTVVLYVPPASKIEHFALGPQDVVCVCVFYVWFAE